MKNGVCFLVVLAVFSAGFKRLVTHKAVTADLKKLFAKKW